MTASENFPQGRRGRHSTRIHRSAVHAVVVCGAYPGDPGPAAAVAGHVAVHLEGSASRSIQYVPSSSTFRRSEWTDSWAGSFRSLLAAPQRRRSSKGMPPAPPFAPDESWRLHQRSRQRRPRRHLPPAGAACAGRAATSARDSGPGCSTDPDPTSPGLTADGSARRASFTGCAPATCHTASVSSHRRRLPPPPAGSSCRGTTATCSRPTTQSPTTRTRQALLAFLI